MVLSIEDAAVLKKIAREYYEKTGKDMVVNSGTRTPRSQAKAMYDNLHKRVNLVHYTDQKAYKEILKAYHDNVRSGESVTVDAMTRVIEAQVSRHEYISRHLRGRAVDVLINDMSSDQLSVFIQAAHHARAQTLPETNHYHLQF